MVVVRHTEEYQVTDFIVIAHRGASGRWPENSLLAFRKAIEAGADWLELDVHLSADRQLVVLHDESLTRTSNGCGLVGEQSLAELRRLDIGMGEPIPLLAEVLDLATGKATVNIELKGKGVATAVAELLRERINSGRQPAEAFLASSLNEKELIRFAGQLPQVRVAPVAGQPGKHTWEWAERLNAWSVHVAKAAVTERLIATARQKKRKLLVYTVNDSAAAKQLKARGIDGVFSDYPERLIGQQNESFHAR